MWRVHPRGNNWFVGATWKLSLRDSVSNRVFSKNKGNVNASHSRIVLRHSLSLTLPLTPPFSTLCHSPSHASVTPPPSLPLTLSRASPPSHLSCSLLSHSDGSLTHPLHCQSIWWCQASSPPVSQFCQVWFCYCVIFSCGFVVFVPKLWVLCVLCLIWLYFYFTKKNVWPWCYHTIIIIIPSLYIWIWSNFL